MSVLVTQLINLFAAVILMLAFAMISQRRILSLIHLFTLQGAALVAATAVVGYVTHQPHLYLSAALTLLLKVILIPLLLYRVIRKLKVRWDVEPLINVPTLMIAGHSATPTIWSWRSRRPLIRALSNTCRSDLGCQSWPADVFTPRARSSRATPRSESPANTRSAHSWTISASAGTTVRRSCAYPNGRIPPPCTLPAAALCSFARRCRSATAAATATSA